MAKVDPIPPDHILKERRKPRFIVDPSSVTLKDDTRVRKWAGEIMKKYEDKFSTYRYKNRQIVARGDVTPESIDIKAIYPYPNLEWIIYRDDRNKQTMWSIVLTSREKHRRKVLCTTTFAKI